MQRLNLTILRLMFDNLIALIFIGNKIDLDLGLPPEIKQIDFEKYPEVRGRVIAFNMAVKFDRSVELALSAEDINILYSEAHLEYSKRPVKYKGFTELKYFDIQNNEITVSEISPFLYFTSNDPLLSKRAVKFNLENGKIIEYRKFISTFNQDIDNSEYQLVDKTFSSGMIHFILGSQTSDSRKSFQSIRSKIGKEANPIIKKLKSIKVRDNKLILES
ncbi:hypothetical protein NIES267_69170 [Calothrix parasitica NIES-267]|uniref:Uncharacterized protein n=1 Tax=Calothrix parasitica NIES-267 TaxID=1973488 RepID=A0A1Z4M1Q0_9CYAN|nr:hypothetical protein NIES267_69170 [Calothrix parasitica NIES-267]